MLPGWEGRGKIGAAGGPGIETRELVAAAQKGDRQAFALLIDEYYSPVFALLCKWTGRRQDAEDVAQETFLRAFKYIRSFRPDQSFKSWIYRIALNAARDHHAARRQHIELDDSVLEQVRSDAVAEQQVRQKQLLRQVYRILPELTDRERSVFVLKTMESLENDEIARILGISETTVRRFYSLARQRILRLLEQEEQRRGSST